MAEALGSWRDPAAGAKARASAARPCHITSALIGAGHGAELLQLVARGGSNREVGKALHISTATVKTHLIHIYDKLGVSDRTSAVTTALERGIITLDSG
ncbi:MAG: response regulator transcription factor [Candidatus Promineifilaceae bacterium]